MLAAAGFDNSDHVAIVVHNYRWRLGVAAGEARYDDFEKKLAEAPVITVPTITLEGDANGAPHPEPAAYRSKFSVKYAHRTITGGIGHNLPRKLRRPSPRRSSRWMGSAPACMDESELCRIIAYIMLATMATSWTLDSSNARTTKRP